MQTGIHVGNKIDMAEAAGPLADALVKVIEAISEHGLDRETGIKALDVLNAASQSAPTTISGCSVSSYPDRPETEPANGYGKDYE